MKNYTEMEIARLQNNLLLIRKAGGWSAEEFGDMIGVTKQTISNLENRKTTMTKTQYIAIRSVLDYEMADRKDDKVLTSAVNLALNSENLSDEDARKVQTFVEGAKKTGIESSAFFSGLAAMVGLAAAEALVMPLAAPVVMGATGVWLAKIIKDRK